MKQFQEKETIKIGYARVSSTDNRQDLGLSIQLEALKDCDKVFYDKDSGSHNDRGELEKAMQLAIELKDKGKEVSLVIYKLDRLTRQMFKLLEIIENLNHSQIKLISLKENIETDSLTGKLLCLILGYVAEMELENISLRTKEGLRKARENGVKLGGKPISKRKEKDILRLYADRTVSLRQITRQLNVSTSTIYRVLERNRVAKNRQNSKISLDTPDKKE